MDLAIELIYELVTCGKSLSAGPLRLRTWIWPSSGRFSSTALTLRPVGMVISLCRDLWGFVHRFGHKCDVFYMSLLEHDH